jgi:hypothetical protein
MSNEPFLQNQGHMVHAATLGDVTHLGGDSAGHRAALRQRGRGIKGKHIQMFLHGGESSIVTEQGEYNVDRLIPQYIKLYLNWTKDTFPSIVRLSWTALMSMFIMIKLVTIAVFASILQTMDPGNECVANAYNYSDYFYFVVQTAFTIGYGNMFPICHSSNLLVTVISFFGMFQMATFTGIFFAKFSMDPRRNYACAFSTDLVGIPPVSSGLDQGCEMVKFNFRFVNVFHRRFFKVSCRLYLIEHRLNKVNEKWLAPLVEELPFFDSSSPLEFMSLPIEVCAYVPFNRLVKLKGRSGSASPAPGLMLPPTIQSRRGLYGVNPLGSEEPFSSTHKWTRYAKKETGKTTQSATFAESVDQALITSEFELVCSLVFTDATTGSEMAVRKSWLLGDTKWLTDADSTVKWQNIVSRDEKSDRYFVDVTGLNNFDNDLSVIGSNDEDRFASSAASPMAYQLINTMTLPSGRGPRSQRPVNERPPAMELFSSIPEEPSNFMRNKVSV